MQLLGERHCESESVPSCKVWISFSRALRFHTLGDLGCLHLLQSLLVGDLFERSRQGLDRSFRLLFMVTLCLDLLQQVLLRLFDLL